MASFFPVTQLCFHSHTFPRSPFSAAVFSPSSHRDYPHLLQMKTSIVFSGLSWPLSNAHKRDTTADAESAGSILKSPPWVRVHSCRGTLPGSGACGWPLGPGTHLLAWSAPKSGSCTSQAEVSRGHFKGRMLSDSPRGCSRWSAMEMLSGALLQQDTANN